MTDFIKALIKKRKRSFERRTKIHCSGHVNAEGEV